jgi:hypothetical protein
MASIKLALSEAQPKRVEILWSGLWKNIRVLFDGEEIGRIADKAELDRGADFTLPDGLGTLRVHFHKEFAGGELRVTRNGHPLPGSASDPLTRVKTAAHILYFIAALNAVLGLVAVLGNVTVLLDLGLGWITVGLGAVFGSLGFLVARKRSTIALIAAIVLFGIDGLLSVGASVGASRSPPIGAIIMRIFLLLPMVRGIGATREASRSLELRGKTDVF